MADNVASDEVELKPAKNEVSVMVPAMSNQPLM